MEQTALRILIISPQFSPIRGGYETAAERLSIALARRSHSVTVVTERRSMKWPAHESWDGIIIRRLPCLFLPFVHSLTSQFFFALYLLFHGRKFDIWYAQQYGLHAIFASAIGKIVGRPVVLKITSTGRQGIIQTAHATWFPSLFIKLLRSVDACVASTVETRLEAISFGITPERIVLLGNGIEIERFRPVNEDGRLRLRKELGISCSGLVIFVGRFSPEKNPEGLLNAWKIALPNLPAGWKLVMIGDGILTEKLIRISGSPGFRDSVIIPGWQQNVEKWLQAANIFILTSNHEGLSNASLEALASGLPVISTRVSGSIETLTESGAGIVVDIGGVEQLANALVTLAADQQLRITMGQHGRKLIESNYSIREVARRHESLYQSLVNRKMEGSSNQ